MQTPRKEQKWTDPIVRSSDSDMSYSSVPSKKHQWFTLLHSLTRPFIIMDTHTVVHFESIPHKCHECPRVHVNSRRTNKCRIYSVWVSEFVFCFFKLQLFCQRLFQIMKAFVTLFLFFNEGLHLQWETKGSSQPTAFGLFWSFHESWIKTCSYKNMSLSLLLLAWCRIKSENVHVMGRLGGFHHCQCSHVDFF